MYSWTTKHLKLTKEQHERGVIFSSVLYCSNGAEPVLHEVFDSDDDKEEKIRRLEDVEFFKNMAQSFDWSVVEEIRR